MAPKAKKTAARKTTAKTSARKSTPKTEAQAQEANATTIEDIIEAERNAKSCAYPSCSARATQEAGGDKKVPSCDIHAEVFNEQHDDGAGIQQLVNSYTGP